MLEALFEDGTDRENRGCGIQTETGFLEDGDLGEPPERQEKHYRQAAPPLNNTQTRGGKQGLSWATSDPLVWLIGVRC